MDCFQPLIEKFHNINNKYPKYPGADAGYRDLKNYIYRQEGGMEKHMNFVVLKK